MRDVLKSFYFRKKKVDARVIFKNFIKLSYKGFFMKNISGKSLRVVISPISR